MKARRAGMRALIASLIAARVTIATFFIVLVSVSVSAWYHIQLPQGRHLVANLVHDLVNGEIKGQLQISEIVSISPTKVVTKNVYLYDAEGRRVAFGKTVTITPDFRAAFRGTLRFAHARLNGGRVNLYPSESGLPTLITAFEARDPTPGIGPPIHAVVDDIQIEKVAVRGEVLGLKGLLAKDFKANWRLEFNRKIQVTVFSAQGQLLEPFPFKLALQDLRGLIETDLARGISLAARLKNGTEHYTVALRYFKDPKKADEPTLDVHVNTASVSARTIQGLGFEWAKILNFNAAGIFVFWPA
ncbi:MAG: hypothetical protein IPJ88_15820 [Myxococcales bacterium]|nr:MAG: hypothetical protein IPJ88_15820 [Myxococcales bacterium]